MKIGIASDHRGYNLKKQILEYLTEKGYDVEDYGTCSEDSVDYPIYAFKVGEAIKNLEINLGILICGTGIGMSIACNKVRNVRCAKVSNLEEAVLCREHNNANVIALSENVANPFEIVLAFVSTDFSNLDKHLKRVEMINNYDN